MEEADMANYGNRSGQVRDTYVPVRCRVGDFIDSDSEADEFNRRLVFDCPSVTLLLLKPLPTYAAVQRTTAVRQLRCECSERSECLVYFKRRLQPKRRLKRLQVQCKVFALRSWEAINRRPPFRPELGCFNIEFPHRNCTRLISPNNGIFDAIVGLPKDTFFFDSLASWEDLTPQPQLRQALRYVKRMPKPNELAWTMVKETMKYARMVKKNPEKDFCCLNCGYLPIEPVTGLCGHTRCTRCVVRTRTCPCGVDTKEPYRVNIVIRNLIDKTMELWSDPRIPNIAQTDRNNTAVPWANNSSIDEPSSSAGSSIGPIKTKRRNRPHAENLLARQPHIIPMTALKRFTYALELLMAGRHMDAARHLAVATASLSQELQESSRNILAQVIMILTEERNPRSLQRDLNLTIRNSAANNWVDKNDLECQICCETYSRPVTTPCGHLFCRICLERTLDYSKRCPLCLYELTTLKLKEVHDTVFMTGALAAVNALVVSDSADGDMIPIFVCTVAFPSVPCPLFVFDPQYHIMIRRVLKSSRRFGMVATMPDKNKKYADYGTILEVRDCVILEDGKSILSTVGLSRFKVKEKCVRDGCEMARIEIIRDVPPRDTRSLKELAVYGNELANKAIHWLTHLNPTVICDIEKSFGEFPLPTVPVNESWWEFDNGPDWIWWLIAVLPLRTEIKILILATDRLIKRMMAVSRTLDAVQEINLTTVTPSSCSRL